MHEVHVYYFLYKISYDLHVLIPVIYMYAVCIIT